MATNLEIPQWVGHNLTNAAFLGYAEDVAKAYAKNGFDIGGYACRFSAALTPACGLSSLRDLHRRRRRRPPTMLRQAAKQWQNIDGGKRSREAASVAPGARRVNIANELSPCDETAAAITSVRGIIEQYKKVAAQPASKKGDDTPEPTPTPDPSDADATSASLPPDPSQMEVE